MKCCYFKFGLGIICHIIWEAKMLKFSALMVTLILQNTKCSIVIDSNGQKGVYLSDYCPKMEFCAEGAHVMCMYYNPAHAMGPRCNRPKNVSITPDLAEKLLEVSNAVRSKIALGREKGKGGDLLPKGYGMFKLKWDNELATFAQVLANQCVLRHDMCRATKRFADPGQTAGLVRFTYPEWFPVSKAGHFTKPGLTASKLSYAITQTLKSWYGQKNAVTPGMISSYPDWAELEVGFYFYVKYHLCQEKPLSCSKIRNPNNQGGRLYLEMIYGPATHMGCGISAYTEYAYYDNNAALNYNSVQVICNYSSRSRKGGPVYQVQPPNEVGYTVRCGCPIGMDEDADCLCIDNRRNAIETSHARQSCAETGNCKPAVVLLPIFTVEDAPPEKLISRSGFDLSQFDKKESEVEISDLYGPADNTSVLHPMGNVPQTNIQSVLGNLINDGYSRNDQLTLGNSPIMDTQLPGSDNIPKTSVRLGYSYLQGKEPQSFISSQGNLVRRNVELKVTNSHNKPLLHDVQKRVFGKNPYLQLKHQNLNTIRPTFNRFQRRKSVFSKVATFELPKTEKNIIKPDVEPRKDFTSVKNLVQDYLKFKKGREDTRKEFFNHDSLFDHRESLNHKTTTERFLHSAEEKVMNYNYYLNNVSQHVNTPTKSVFEFDNVFSREKSNNKLMTLLDNLEQEVKHIELDRNKKEIFDAKIRRIYGTVVGESGLPKYKSDHEPDFTDAELTDFNKYEPEHNRHSDLERKTHLKKPNHKTDVEELNKNLGNIHDKYNDFENEIRPVSRSQDTLYSDKLRHLNQRNIIKAKEGYESDMKHSYSDGEEIKANLHKGIFSSANYMKSDHTYGDKEVLRNRNVYSDTEDNKKPKYLEKRKFRNEDDPLDINRRRYYQSKLENLERKLHKTRSVKRHKDNNRQVRPVLPAAREEQPLRPSKNQPDPFYMPERARFLHGF